MFKKSQAAMEFLMTYGWAILVVLVAIGALAYFGVLSPDKFLPSKCQLPSGIACNDFVIDSTTGNVDVVLRNGLGFTIDPITVTIDGGGCSAVDATTQAALDCPLGTETSLPNGDQCRYQAACGVGNIPAGKFSADLIVGYTNSDSGISHSIEGTIVGQAE